MREELKQYVIRGIKGINQQERLADPELELADARNLWAPNGRLEKRPGYWGVGTVQITPAIGTGTITMYKEDPIGTFTQTGTFNSLPVTSRFYFSITALDTESLYPCGIGLTTGINSNNVVGLYEYWNGNLWAPLDVAEFDSATSYIQDTTLLGSNNAILGFSLPRDMAKTTIAAVNAYWVRCTLQNAGDTAFDAATSISGAVMQKYNTASPIPKLFLVSLPFTNSKRYISAYRPAVDGVAWWQSSTTLRGHLNTNELYVSTLTPYSNTDEDPPAVAVIPQFGEAYIAYGRVVTLHKENVTTTTDSGNPATVETDPSLIGTIADYDPSFVPQLGSWPPGQYIAYHRGELWSANFLGATQQIRWSAAAPAYKVWPIVNTDVLTDTDESPITALYPFNQNMFVFKERSIWQMVYTGLNDQNLNTYRGEKVVSGIGCVAQNSIQDVQGNLIFLGADGIYSFNGVKAQRISDRVSKTVDTIFSGKKRFATAVNWTEKSLYILAVNTKGDLGNDTLIVWDYKNNSWWIWDDVNVVSFFIQGRVNDRERVYFLDQGGRLFQLGQGLNNNGGMITAYGITQRLADDPETKRLRIIDPRATNTSRSLNIEISANDAPFEALTDTTVTFVDGAEKPYQAAIYNADKYTTERDRRAHMASLSSGEWFRLKFTHSEQYAPLVLNEIIVAPVDVGRRA